MGKLLPRLRFIMNTSFETPEYHASNVFGPKWDVEANKVFGNGLDYTIFKSADSMNVVLAFRGTEPLSITDWRADVKQLVGLSEQYIAAGLATGCSSYYFD